MNKTEQCLAMGITAACGLIINPWAAIGAFGGCCFFMAMPSVAGVWWKRTLSAMFSWIMGYASGVFFYPGPPWSQEAMLISGAVSALVSVVFTSLYASIERDTDLPKWLVTAIDMLKNWGRK